MPAAVSQALSQARLSLAEIDGIAFTRGPGMGGCLAVACNAAKTLAAAINKPLVGVHHMQAHALTPFLTSPTPPCYPFLTLLVSGGHTLLLLAKSSTSFTQLATTTDISIGNAYDKVAKVLEIPRGSRQSPGAALEQFSLLSSDRGLVDTNREQLETTSDTSHSTIPINLPPFPLTLYSKLQFSYSGIISHVLRLLESTPQPSHLVKVEIARAFQTAAVSQLEEKLLLALRWCENRQIEPTGVVVSGGVASNAFLRSRLHSLMEKRAPSLSLTYPPPALCTDNAAMIAWASMERFLGGDHDTYLIEPRPSWPLEELQPK